MSNDGDAKFNISASTTLAIGTVLTLDKSTSDPDGDGTFSFNYSDGTSFTTSNLTGPQGSGTSFWTDNGNGWLEPNGVDGQATNVDIFGNLKTHPYKLSGPFGSEQIAGSYLQRFSMFLFFLIPF